MKGCHNCLKCLFQVCILPLCKRTKRGWGWPNQDRVLGTSWWGRDHGMMHPQFNTIGASTHPQNGRG